MVSKFSKNLRSANLERLIGLVETMSRPGAYGTITINIVDGAVGDHSEIKLKVQPARDDLRKEGVSRTLDELVSISAE